jgi:hypothetical protein
MIQHYDEHLLQQHFPSRRDAPPPGVFELAIACCGGTATGPYVAGVLDFLWEAFEEWRAAARSGTAPDHTVRITHLVGTSAGGLSSGLAALATIKAFPHVYHDDLWTQYRAADPSLPPVQPKTDNPHYRAWVSEISLDRLLSHPEEVESGQIYLFHSAPAEICATVLHAIQPFPAASGRDWVADPLEFRGTIGNLDGVPYTLNFNTLGAAAAVTSEWFTAHRDNVGFAFVTGHVGGAPTGFGGAPDCHDLPRGLFDGPPPSGPTADARARALFDATMVATSAIPLVFKVTPVPQTPIVYEWRPAYWDRDRNAAVHDLPVYVTPPSDPINYRATDGGLFDNKPFNLAHQRLVGVRGSNPQDGLLANRAVLLVDPLADDAEPPPPDPKATDLFTIIARLVLTPIAQDRLDTLDLAQIKSEAVFSRYMISPTRPSERNPHTVDWPPTMALLSAPMDAFLGFAAQAYREHDFLLGRRNAQQFLRKSFALPKDNPIVRDVGGWTAPDEFTENGVTYRALVPLRGRALDEQPLPRWSWQALTDADIKRYTGLVESRANAIFHNLKDAAASGKGVMGALTNAAIRLYLNVGWPLARGRILDLFKSTMTAKRDSLNPATRP